MPAPSLKLFSWSNAETYAKRKNNQEDKILQLRIRKINKEQKEAKQQKFEKVQEIKRLTEDLGESTGYGRVEKSYGVFGSVKVIHEYEKVPPKLLDSQNVTLEKMSAKTEEAGWTNRRTTAPGACVREFHRKFGKRDFSKVRSLDLVNNSVSPLRVHGKKAELQRRAVQLKTMEKDKTSSESQTDFDDAKSKESDSSASVQEIQTQKEEPGAVSPFNTLLLPPAHKLSTTRIVGRRALSAPPFDKKYLLEARSSGLLEKKLHNSQSGKRTDKDSEVHKASNRRSKSAVPIDLYVRAVQNGLSTDYIVPRVNTLQLPMSIRYIRRQAEAIRLENHEKQWRQLIEKYSGQDKIKTTTVKINNFLRQ